MVNVGIIGLGPVWDSRYFPALEKLRDKISVRAIYDPVAARAEQVAEELHSTSVPGVVALTEQTGIQAVLLLDAAWHGYEVLKLVRAGRKPAYIAGSLGEDLARLRCLHKAAVAESLTIMPEFSLRYTPATSRLQELMATRLGRPRRIVIDAVAPRPDDPHTVPGQRPGIDFLVGLLDWCWYVVRMAPVRLQALALETNGNGDTQDRSVTLEFSRPRAGGEAPVAELRIRHQPLPENAPAGPSGPLWSYEIICERGKAGICAPAEISWSEGSEPITESLTSDRSAVEVMLDLFCRRIVGGLIPVADLADVCRSIALAQAVEQSFCTGRAVALTEPH